MGARDFFESARAASRDAARARAELERMEQRRLSLGSSAAASVSSSRRDVNGTAASIALVDREAALHRRVEEDYRLLDMACEVIYGADGEHGIRRGLGPAYADVVWHRACGDETWAVVSALVGLSRRTCVRYYGVAMDYVDSVGLEGAAGSSEV